MNRRTFLSALASIPGLAWLDPKALLKKPQTPDVTDGQIEKFKEFVVSGKVVTPVAPDFPDKAVYVPYSVWESGDDAVFLHKRNEVMTMTKRWDPKRKEYRLFWPWEDDDVRDV